MKIIQKTRFKIWILPKSCRSDLLAKQHSAIVNLLGGADHLLVNGIQTVEIDESWSEMLLLIKNKLESLGKKMRLVNFSSDLEAILVGGAFNFKQAFKAGAAEAMQDFKLVSEQESKDNFIKAFIQATPRVLYIQAQVLSRQMKLSMKKSNLTLLPGVISGVVRVTTFETFYAVILSFPEGTFLKIISQMLGEVYTELNKDIQDGAAELLNIIYGQVRAQFKDSDTGTLSEIPFVVAGNQLTTLDFKTKGSVSIDAGKMVTIPFETGLGSFFIEVWLPNDFKGNLF